MGITAKSVVLDIADNWGDPEPYMSIRSIEFLLDGVVIPMTSGFTAYSTSEYNASYSPANAFNTSLSKTGSWSLTTWVSGNGSKTLQRLSIVFDSPVEFDEIVINNGHHSSDYVLTGAKNIVVTASPDEITSTVYEDTVTNPSVLFAGELPAHVALDQEDPQTVFEVIPTSITAKSVVIDIANNYGHLAVGLRSIEFFLDNALVDVLAADVTCYATTVYPGLYTAALAFDTTLSKTGIHTGNQWMSYNVSNNQRLICVFDSEITFDEIRINNSHVSGGLTDTSAKDIVVTSSIDEITSTVYGDAISNSTVLYSGEVRQHVSTNIEDPETILISVSSGGQTLRTILAQAYYLIGDYLRADFDQDYSLTERKVTWLVQVYGLRILNVLLQLYGNSPQHRAKLAQHYGDHGLLRRILAQGYGDAARYRSMFDQDWNMPEDLRQINLQRYSIAEGQLRAWCDQAYDISEVELLRSQLDQLYVLAAGDALVQRTDQTVHCAGVEHTSAYNIFIEQDEDLFHMVGELQLADEVEFLQYHAFETEVVISVDGQEFHFIVDGHPRKSRNPEENLFIIPLVSATVLLDSPHNQVGSGDLVGMASGIVANLALPYAVDWGLVDWFISAGILTGLGDSAMAIIKKIVAAAGGVVQTSPDGVLVCRPEYPVSVNQWQVATPEVELTDQDDFFAIDPSPVSRPGYNVFFLTNQSLAADGVSMDIDQLSSSQAEIRVRLLPWSDTKKVNMLHSGGSWVQVVAQGVVLETIKEKVEIIGGAGQTTKPVAAYVGHEYSEVDLGNVTVGEGGNVSTTVPGNSLLQLTYQTSFWSFLATDLNIEDVQFFPEIIEL